MSEPAPDPPWSIARVARSTAGADLAIWTVGAVHRQQLDSESEVDMAIQHLLADGYDLYLVTQSGGIQFLWFKARLPGTRHAEWKPADPR